jgi:hypothetical protein
MEHTGQHAIVPKYSPWQTFQPKNLTLQHNDHNLNAAELVQTVFVLEKDTSNRLKSFAEVCESADK